MAECLHQEMSRQSSQRLEAFLIKANLNQQQHDHPQPDNFLDPQLFSAAKEGAVDEFIEVLAGYCEKERVSLPVLLGQRSPLGNTLLHAAAETVHNVRAIIDFFPKHLINYENSRGETPLHIAARAGNVGVVELFLSKGASACPDHCGDSALHEAVRNCHYDVINLLVSKKPSLLYCQNNESKSPLCIAVERGDVRVLMLLLNALENDEDWSQRNFGMSPVHVALIHKRMDMLIMMRENKPWLFQLRDAGHGTPLHLAVYRNYLNGVRLLMKYFSVSASEQDSMGYLPIHVACVMNRIEIVEELLRQWQDPAEFLTRRGQNILHVSARHGCIATVKYILENPKFGHLINARDFDGNTSLHLAALHCQPSVVLLARDQRVDLKLVNKNNMAALDVVEQGIKGFSFGKSYTLMTMQCAGASGSGNLAIHKSTSRSPQKRPEVLRDWEGHRSLADSHAVVLALVASVTYTSGFSVPGGYNGTERDAGMPILLHKAMYNVFVINNSLAMYSSITSLGILLCSYVNDPYVAPFAVHLSNIPLFVTCATMPLAFMAGVYVTVSKLVWLSIFVLLFGSVPLFILLSFFMFNMVVLLGYKLPLIGRFVDQLLICVLRAIGGGTIEWDYGAAATSIRGAHDATAPT